VREILADLDTPLSLFRALDDGRTSFLLESVEGGEKWARYSFIGTGARALFRARGRAVEWVERGETQRFEAPGDPLEVLRARLAEYRPVAPPGLDLPRFTGGAVGMIGYDWVRFVERIPDSNPDELGLPDLWFVLPETVVVYDNVRHTARVIRHVDLRDGADPDVRYREAEDAIEAVVAKLRGPRPAQPRSEPVRAPMQVRRSMEREAYAEVVKRAKEYVVAGDIFQVVLGFRHTVPLQVDPFTLYRQLRLVNPSPYLFFVRMEGPVLIGSSPEILVRLEGRQIDVRPIAGTRRRGRDAEDERRMEQELVADPKERAEHLMLVDLGRNDVGRVAEIGSVQVTEYASSSAIRTSCTSSRTCRDACGAVSTGSTCCGPLFRPARSAGHPRCEPWGSSTSSRRCAGGPTEAASDTSTTRATWTWRSPSEPWSCTTA
jgi:anthranilate synthase component 1